MLEIRQLTPELKNLVDTYKKAVAHYDDPLYIAWMIQEIYTDSVGRMVDNWQVNEEIVRARHNIEFRAFWIVFKRCDKLIRPFQDLESGIIPVSVRKEYREKFMKENPEEVPF